MQPTPILPDTPMHATLTAQEWNVVLGSLGESPYRISAPIIQKLGMQLGEQQAEISASTEPALRPNGEDVHVQG